MFIDEFSRNDYIYFLHENLKSFDILKNFKVEVKNQLSKRIKSIKYDHGGKYYVFKEELIDYIIKFTC